RAAELALHPEGTHVVIGSGTDLRVFVTAQDAYGNPARLDEVELFVDGAVAERRTLPDGRIAAVVPAPDRWAGRGHVEVEAVLDGSYARQDVAVVSAAAARAEGAAAGEPLVTLTPRLGVLWNLHQSPGAAFTLEALRRSPWTPALAFGASLGYLRGGGTAADGLGVSQLILDEMPLLALGRARVQQRRLDASTALGLGVLLAHGRMRSLGATVAGNGVAFALQAGVELGVRLR